jgi:hypothetical protein
MDVRMENTDDRLVSTNCEILRTRRMTKRPTNLTEKAQPSMAPVRLSQVHHSTENGLSWRVMFEKKITAVNREYS